MFFDSSTDFLPGVQDMSRMESGEAVQCERELACYLQDCESLVQQLNQELKVLRDEKYYQVEQLAFRWVHSEGLVFAGGWLVKASHVVLVSLIIIQQMSYEWEKKPIIPDIGEKWTFWLLIIQNHCCH